MPSNRKVEKVWEKINRYEKEFFGSEERREEGFSYGGFLGVKEHTDYLLDSAKECKISDAVDEAYNLGYEAALLGVLINDDYERGKVFRSKKEAEAAKKEALKISDEAIKVAADIAKACLQRKI